jgi:2-polyprenyl-6-methoxyphenol hydroxylase-like FAD-dependent oxidoreductase
MNEQELRALFFERLEHLDAEAEYELRHSDDVLETPQFAVSGFPNRSHSVVNVVNQGSMSVSRAVPEEGWMKLTNRDVLISGASVAGPTLAWWLCRSGFTPTVVEQTPALRAGLGGHAVDLLGRSVDVAEWMGILPKVLAARTRTELISLQRPGKPSVELDMSRLVAGISERHVEIMRGELTSILYEATRDEVEYLFGDSIRTLQQDGDGVEVTFEHGPPRRFGLVVGADGLHSGVRRLAFGEEARFRHWLGGYLGVFSLPNYLGLEGRMVVYSAPGRTVAMYPVRQTGEARAVFLFRRAEELDYDHRDPDQQRQLLREAFAEPAWELPRLLSELEHADDFYFDSISQIRMPSWSSGRVTLVGDAGYCPGPAVGGGTALAVIGAYVLAGELRAAGGDPATAFPSYERRLGELVRRSRTIGPTVMKTLIPRTRLQVWLTTQALRLVPRLPATLQRKLSAFQGRPARALAAITLKDYQPTA